MDRRVGEPAPILRPADRRRLRQLTRLQWTAEAAPRDVSADSDSLEVQSYRGFERSFDTVHPSGFQGSMDIVIHRHREAWEDRFPDHESCHPERERARLAVPGDHDP